MDKIEDKIQNYLVQYIIFFPNFIDDFDEALKEAFNPVQALNNFAEQLRDVERVNLEKVDATVETQQSILFSIGEGMEDEIAAIKSIVAKLNKLYGDFKNKLTTVENCSVSLDWSDKNSAVICGGALQPSLDWILQNSLDIMLHFKKIIHDINDKLANMNVRDEKVMFELENVFKVDVRTDHVNKFIAMTQYIRNPFDTMKNNKLDL